MPRIQFPQLVDLYRNTNFAVAGDEHQLTVVSQELADLLVRLETDDAAVEDCGVELLDEIEDATVGSAVRIRIRPPRAGLGVLARDLAGLVTAPGAKLREPTQFHLLQPAFTSGDAYPPESVVRYRKALALIDLFADAATFLDTTKAELIFVKDGKFVVPINYDDRLLVELDLAAADTLLAQFADPLHRDQKLEILFEALIDLSRAQRSDARFTFLLRNLDEISRAVSGGYNLFASSFSYRKIRSEVEDARIEYTQKIHRTIVDIQGQLLGIPVATFVVASQMKAPTACGIELSVNRGILWGAYIFVILLLMAILNQWMTLSAIAIEVKRQRTELAAKYPGTGEDFAPTFAALNTRIGWHRFGLIVIALIGIGGAYAAHRFDHRITAMPIPKCITVTPHAAGPSQPGAGKAEVAKISGALAGAAAPADPAKPINAAKVPNASGRIHSPNH